MNTLRHVPGRQGLPTCTVAGAHSSASPFLSVCPKKRSLSKARNQQRSLVVVAVLRNHRVHPGNDRLGHEQTILHCLCTLGTVPVSHDCIAIGIALGRHRVAWDEMGRGQRDREVGARGLCVARPEGGIRILTVDIDRGVLAARVILGLGDLGVLADRLILDRRNFVAVRRSSPRLGSGGYQCLLCAMVLAAFSPHYRNSRATSVHTVLPVLLVQLADIGREVR